MTRRNQDADTARAWLERQPEYWIGRAKTDEWLMNRQGAPEVELRDLRRRWAENTERAHQAETAKLREGLS